MTATIADEICIMLAELVALGERNELGILERTERRLVELQLAPSGDGRM